MAGSRARLCRSASEREELAPGETRARIRTGVVAEAQTGEPGADTWESASSNLLFAKSP